MWIIKKDSMFNVHSSQLSSEIFRDGFDFEKTALEIFRFQATENIVYKKYIEQLKINPGNINSISEIPFLPIHFFKTHQVVTPHQTTCPGLSQPVPACPDVSGMYRESIGDASGSNIKRHTIFTSSGTTGNESSKHYIADLKIYEQSLLKCFELFYGNIEEYCLLALLPSYLEKKDSSLIYMTGSLITKSKHPKSGFYLNNFNDLSETLKQLEKQKEKTILLGVTYALLDFAEKFPIKLKHTIIMETGGMKGKRKELLREEVHKIVCDAFSITKVHSEYGMTELLSQAYSKGDGIFFPPPWMKIFIRDMNDPMALIDPDGSGGKTGGINIIDLANIYSCSFIATQDLGKKHNDACLPDRQGSFEVLGRFDDGDLRGCNLMIE
jgi:phenylacetate-coenzyme A ligase PaaK-like adenylate-forming protein